MASLYRKYRPRTFGELAGQDTVVTAVANALTLNQTVHAYLFTGPRGSGKTSTARLLAKALNCQQRGQATDGRNPADPCNACEICKAGDDGRLLDLIEIDAASNRGIENMRDIRQQVAYAPSMARHKVYIIDEVHMLSKEAANAFLKTLEEPPPFVVFILATTEVHKILPTIVSRCQRYDFRKVDYQASLKRLKDVAALEKLSITDEALGFIVGRGDGSLRDMLGLLDQVVAFRVGDISIDQEMCLAALGMAGEDTLMELFAATIAPDPGKVIQTLNQLERRGIDASVLALQMVEFLRKWLYLATGNRDRLAPGSPWLDQAETLIKGLGTTGVLALLERVSEAQSHLRTAPIPYFTLELALLKGGGFSDLAARLERVEQLLASPERPALPAQSVAPVKAVPAPTTAPVPPAAPPRPAPVAPLRAAPPPAAFTPPTPRPPPVALRAAPEPVSPPIPPPAAVPAPPTDIVRLATIEDEEPALPVEAEPTGAAEPMEKVWERVLVRIREMSPRTAAVLKEVVALAPKGAQMRLLVRKGHSFAMTSLRQETHTALVRDALEKELGKKLTILFEEDASDTVRPAADEPVTAPAKDWIEKKATKSKAVQSVISTLDAEIIRVD